MNVYGKTIFFGENGHADVSQLTAAERDALLKSLQMMKDDETPEIIVSKFLSCHRFDQLEDVGIDEMRRIIPKFYLLLGNHDCRSSRKVKGLWDKAPEWWDPQILFLDPNNGRKSKSGKTKKPTKTDLLPILQYLFDRYKTKHEDQISVSTCHQVSDSPGDESAILDGNECDDMQCGDSDGKVHKVFDGNNDVHESFAEVTRCIKKLPRSPDLDELIIAVDKLFRSAGIRLTAASMDLPNALEDISDHVDFLQICGSSGSHMTSSTDERERALKKYTEDVAAATSRQPTQVRQLAFWDMDGVSTDAFEYDQDFLFEYHRESSAPVFGRQSEEIPELKFKEVHDILNQYENAPFNFKPDECNALSSTTDDWDENMTFVNDFI